MNARLKHYQLKRAGVIVLGAMALLQVSTVRAQNPVNLAQVEFGPEFFRGGGSTPVDVSRFSRGNPFPAGDYRLDIYVNDAWIGRNEVTFRSSSDDEDFARPCYSRKLLDAIGVDLEKLSEAVRATLISEDPKQCLRLEDMVPDATMEFDSGDLRLNLSIPQISLRRSARGYVSPDMWDRGVTAAMLGYHFNTFSTSGSGRTNTSYYANLNSGVNLGDWRFRNISSITRSGSGPTRVQAIASYAQRSLLPLNSLLTVGDASTSGQMFDTIAFRGAQLASDPRMLPDSMSGYAPVVRGLARTNARVQVRQNNNVIYETTVAPGRFEINDLYPTGFGGNLRVIVTEADGSTSSFEVPYASVSQLLRPDTYRYSLTAGRTRSAFNVGSSNFMQGTYEHGLNNAVTLSGGMLAASDYVALVGGGALSTPLGAFGLSMTRSHARLAEDKVRNGQSLKLDYNKNLVETGTNIALAAFRYSSSGYLRLQDMQALKAAQQRGNSRFAADRPRSQLQLSLSQSLGERRGSFYAVGTSQNYWNRAGSGSTFSLGYSNNWKSISYNFSAQRQRELLTRTTGTQYMFSMSMPLGREISSPTISTNVSRDQHRGTALQTSLNGTVGEQRNMSYGVTANRSPGNSGGSVNGEYRAPYAHLGASYGYSNGGHRQMSATASGGVVAYSGGVVLAQNLGDTIGIVEAKGAAGADVNQSGVRLNEAGQAVVPYLTPFRNNEVLLDPKGTSTDVELKSTSQRVAPVAGAVVVMKYETSTGRSVLINAYRDKGEVVPFSADVLDEEGNVLGMVGQGGMIFIRTATDSGLLTLRWGSERHAQCQIRYALEPRTAQQPTNFDQITAMCEDKSESGRNSPAIAPVDAAPAPGKS
ncbi:fimbria/pilus outer membrane usher protein [Herbaspirillum sp. alder98]|uniref:fimbria/pilus outer membrane usher protein n=1 Tax=Herbaspirillum sp. alder98 TaxID=2913096 RepID=UPI001CD88662|nr:fimbria/pilus outer membrane usher protein [Herbaspirillum sp. alder98]MCA1324591.1 fimbrial biogenesis outer membrane usher protein [Herbaspirillum sp. alder98]